MVDGAGVIGLNVRGLAMMMELVSKHVKGFAIIQLLLREARTVLQQPIWKKDRNVILTFVMEVASSLDT